MQTLLFQVHQPTIILFLKNIKQVQPGKYILFYPNKKYSMPKFYKKFKPNEKLKKKINSDDLQKEVLSILKNKVSERASGNKNVGIFLSGGVDGTNSHIGTTQKNLPQKKKIVTFTASFENFKSKELIGEQDAVKKICKYYNSRNIVVPIKSKDLIKNMGTYSSPETGILEYCNRALAKAAKLNGIDVVLSGEGSDEMFIGYDHNLSIIAIINKKFFISEKKNINYVQMLI